MVLTFENGNYIEAYKDHLENKTTIKKNRCLVIFILWNLGKAEILAATKLTILNQTLLQVEKAT